MTNNTPGAVSDREMISHDGYAWLDGEKALRSAVFPAGVAASPYEVLNYDAELTLHDARGLSATFARRQRIQFVQDGVRAILDHLWGDGIAMTYYSNSAGTLEGSYNDRGRRHLVIALKWQMQRGATRWWRLHKRRSGLRRRSITRSHG